MPLFQLGSSIGLHSRLRLISCRSFTMVEAARSEATFVTVGWEQFQPPPEVEGLRLSR
jgi:hypothetical protein